MTRRRLVLAGIFVAAALSGLAWGLTGEYQFERRT